MRRSVTAVVILGVAWAATGLAAQTGQLRRFELPNLDTLELVLPAGWVDSVDQPPGGVDMTIQLRPAQGAPFEVFIAPEWPDADDLEVPDSGALKSAVADAAIRIQAQAVERPLEIRSLEGANGIGYYFSATDAAPAEDAFKYMNQGALQVGNLTVWFTILTNDGQENVVADALAMIQQAVYRGTGLDRR
ncbi:MAG: hypothetical protein ACREVI_01145 [Steroidobacteraceae bacterium]